MFISQWLSGAHSKASDTYVSCSPPNFKLALILMLTLYQPHGNDVRAIGTGEDFTEYFIRFVATLDPNGGSADGSNRTVLWPRYDPVARQMLFVQDGEERLAVGRDDARQEAIEAVAALSLKYPL